MKEGLYEPLLKEGRVWSKYDWYSECFVQYCRGVRLFIEGDTIINEKTYKKVFGKFIYALEAPVFVPPFGISEVPGLVGFMREDTVTRRVYTYITYDDRSEYLTYDFSLRVGDTLQIEYLNEGDYAILDSITDFRLYNGELRRQFHFSAFDYLNYPLHQEYKYIEGVGGREDLLIPFGFNFEGGSVISCFRQSGEILYDFSQAYGCEMITNTNMVPVEKYISIFPNPSTSEINIEVKNQKSILLELLFLDGKVLFSTDKIKPNMRMDLRSYPKGIYFLRSTNEFGLIQTQRIVKF
ncbi:MAG: T9SS type A sorting domain-containing protein [Bacteroidota bacterium]